VSLPQKRSFSFSLYNNIIYTCHYYAMSSEEKQGLWGTSGKYHTNFALIECGIVSPAFSNLQCLWLVRR
jgi:hypothetical protein